MKLKKRSTLRVEAQRFCRWRARRGGLVRDRRKDGVLVAAAASVIARMDRAAGVIPLDEIFARNEREGRLA